MCGFRVWGFGSGLDVSVFRGSFAPAREDLEVDPASSLNTLIIVSLTVVICCFYLITIRFVFKDPCSYS